MAVKVVENSLPHRLVRLDADERGTKALDVKAGERLRLGQLDVHRHEIYLLDLLARQEIVQRDRPDFPRFDRTAGAVREFPVARRAKGTKRRHEEVLYGIGDI